MKSPLLLQNVDERKQAVAWALNFARNTSLDPGPYERELLARFVEGKLTIDQVVAQLEDTVPTQQK